MEESLAKQIAEYDELNAERGSPAPPAALAPAVDGAPVALATTAPCRLAAQRPEGSNGAGSAGGGSGSISPSSSRSSGQRGVTAGSEVGAEALVSVAAPPPGAHAWSSGTQEAKGLEGEGEGLEG